MGIGHDDMNIIKKATFAGGCFWCMAPPFQMLDGVLDIKSGYTGGNIANPSYKQVSTGNTGHYEAAEVTYDASKITYTKLLDTFWKNIDPTDEGGQFLDRGSQYKTAIFYHDEQQRLEAEKSKEKINSSGKFAKPVKTKILKASEFYPAEDYHLSLRSSSNNLISCLKSGLLLSVSNIHNPF